MRRTRLSSFVLISLALASISCGGGGGGGNNGGGNNGGGTPPPATLTITTKSILPAGLQGHAYSTTLAATGGQGALHWSIAKLTPTSLFVDGLTIDANTGVISGTPTFGGTGGFTATVTDSASHTATAGFTITDFPQLTSASAQAATISEFTSPVNVRSGITGGLPPVSFVVSSGTIPPGMRFNGNGQLVGSAYTLGTYQFTISAQDSYSPPETASQPFTITVLAPPLSVANSLPSHVPLNRPFSGRIIAVGGTPPYSFSVIPGFGSLPTGLSLDPGTGIVSGTPTVKGSGTFLIMVADSSSPPQNQIPSLGMSVDVPLGRNDSPATATPIDNGNFFGSISPYVDPPNGPPVAADNDYYKLVSLAGATVHIETFAKRNTSQNPLDTVIEIVDGNGIRLNACRQPGDTAPNFTGACINDDISASPHVQDSALDFLVPGASSTNTTFYVHVFDWRGDARPDMTYNLLVFGLVHPMVISSPPAPAARGLFSSQQFTASPSRGIVSWSLVGGSLPPGLTLSTTGVLSGTPTTDGSYSFTLQASDTGPPAQVVTADLTMVVAEPVKINFSGTMPNACAGQPYSFQVPTTGGTQPFTWFWTLFSPSLIPINFDQSTATFSGTTSTLGTFTGTLFVTDSAQSTDSKTITLTVQQCP